ADERDVQIEGESFTWPRVDERAPGRQSPERRPQDEVPNLVDEEKGHEHARADCDARANDARSEFVEVIQKSHVARARLVAWIVGLERLKCAHVARFYRLRNNPGSMAT